MSEGVRPVASLHVLVVEDDAAQREALVAVLADLGCRVDFVVDGGAAVSQAMALRPDVVLMDLELPIIDGFQAIRQIRQMIGARPLQIVVLTGRVDERSRALAFEAGCDALVPKPCDIHALLRAAAARLTAARASSGTGRA